MFQRFLPLPLPIKDEELIYILPDQKRLRFGVSFKVSACFWILSGHERLGTVEVCGVGRVAGWLFLTFLTTMVVHKGRLYAPDRRR